jgi:hypothetical protein
MPKNFKGVDGRDKPGHDEPSRPAEIDYHCAADESGAGRSGEWARMLPRLISTLVKVAVASLIVGTILDHFGLSAGVLLKEVGLTPERVAELARHGLAWALPNVLLGALIIVPIWFVAYLFRPPGQHSD